jgi:hypothetical protein
VIADPASTSAWSFGGSILTFAFPMILFIVVACALYVAYTKPELVPGHRNPAAQRPVSYTAVPGEPPADNKPTAGRDEQARGGLGPAAAGGKASRAVPPGKQEPEGGE